MLSMGFRFMLYPTSHIRQLACLAAYFIVELYDYDDEVCFIACSVHACFELYIFWPRSLLCMFHITHWVFYNTHHPHLS